MDLNLKSRVAVITGGAAGIGEAIGRAFAAEGCDICIVDRDGNAAAKAAAAFGPKASSAAVDVGNAAAVQQAFQTIAKKHQRLDILVNAAGVLSTGLVADLPVSEWQRVNDVNLSGVLYCAKAAIP